MILRTYPHDHVILRTLSIAAFIMWCVYVLISVDHWSHWTTDLLTHRASSVGLSLAPYPGVDMTLLLGSLFYRITNLSQSQSLALASYTALIPYLWLVFYKMTGISGRLLATSPIVFSLFVAGMGWTTIGFAILWRMLTILPKDVPHRSMPLIGMSVGIAYVAIPQFSAFLLPLAAMIFVSAPHHMIGKHMRVFYLLCFTPVTMIALSFYYSASLFEVVIDTHIDLSTPITPIYVALLALLTVAPTLLRWHSTDDRSSRIVILAVPALTIMMSDVWLGPALAATAIGQAANPQQYSPPLFICGLALVSSTFVLFILDAFPLFA